jgi:hypothetical protein
MRLHINCSTKQKESAPQAVREVYLALALIGLKTFKNVFKLMY